MFLKQPQPNYTGQIEISNACACNKIFKMHESCYKGYHRNRCDPVINCDTCNDALDNKCHLKIYDSADGYLCAEGELDDAPINGYWKFYYPSGAIASEGRRQEHTYGWGSKGSINSGYWKHYYPSGCLSMEGAYNSPNTVGTATYYRKGGVWKHYYDSGSPSIQPKLKCEELYVEDNTEPITERKQCNPKSSKTYDIDGNLLRDYDLTTKEGEMMGLLESYLKDTSVTVKQFMEAKETKTKDEFNDFFINLMNSK